MKNPRATFLPSGTGEAASLASEALPLPRTLPYFPGEAQPKDVLLKLGAVISLFSLCLPLWVWGLGNGAYSQASETGQGRRESLKTSLPGLQRKAISGGPRPTPNLNHSCYFLSANNVPGAVLTFLYSVERAPHPAFGTGRLPLSRRRPGHQKCGTVAFSSHAAGSLSPIPAPQTLCCCLPSPHTRPSPWSLLEPLLVKHQTLLGGGGFTGDHSHLFACVLPAPGVPFEVPPPAGVMPARSLHTRVSVSLVFLWS